MQIDTDFGFSGIVHELSWESASQLYVLSGAIGLTLLLGKIMTILSELMDFQVQKLETVKTALTLVNIALEGGGPSLSIMGPLVDVLRGDVCRHLLRATQSDDLEIFSLVLRVVFNLFMSIKDHMKVQLEVFLSSVHLRILGGKSASSSVAKEELALESLLEFCREPALMHDIYTNYDCDVQCTNLFDAVIHTLCARAVPTVPDPIGRSATPRKSGSLPVNAALPSVAPGRISVLHRLALDGALAILRTVAIRCSGPGRWGAHQSPHSNRGIGEIQSSRSAAGFVAPTLCNETTVLLPTETLISRQVDRWCGHAPTNGPDPDGSTSPPHRSRDPPVPTDGELPLPPPQSSPVGAPHHSGQSNSRVAGADYACEIPRSLRSASSTSGEDSVYGWEGSDLTEDADMDTEYLPLARAKTAEVGQTVVSTGDRT